MIHRIETKWVGVISCASCHETPPEPMASIGNAQGYFCVSCLTEALTALANVLDPPR